MTQAGTGIGGWLLQAVVVIVGWVVVHLLSRARDLDKARREIVGKSADAVVAQVNDLLLLGREYHLKVRDSELEIRLKLGLQDLSLLLNATCDLAESKADAAACRSALVGFRRALTFQHFEDEHVGALPLGAPELERIAECAGTLKRTLLRIKASQFLQKSSKR